MIWTELLHRLKTGGSFLISSHVSADGDCIGSQLAMLWYLRSLGKDVVVYNHDPVPPKFGFLSLSSEITTKRPDRTFDVFIVLDCSNPERLGWEGADALCSSTVNIDHHRDNSRFADINIVDDRAAATGEIIHRFFEAQNIDYPVDVAEALYTAVMTDTGGFRFSNTSASVLAVCSDLAKRGARCSAIYKQVYDRFSRNGLLLRAKIWSTLRYALNDRVCILSMPYSWIDEFSAVYSDSEGMVDYTVLADGVEVGLFIKHNENETHFSLRSKGRIDVGKVAQTVPSGGGHENAAGCTIPKPCDRALEDMLAIISKELSTL